MTRVFITLISLLSAASAIANPLPLLWSRIYDGGRADSEPEVRERIEGGFAICYKTNSFGVGDYQICLMLTDEYGNIESSRTYGGQHNEVFSEFYQTADSGYIIAGATGTYGDYPHWAAWLIKTDRNGDTLWTQVYDPPHDCYQGSVAVSNEGYYFLVERDIGGDGAYLVLLKYSLSGDSLNVLEVPPYMIGDTTFYVFPSKVIVADNGDIILYGRASGWWYPEPGDSHHNYYTWLSRRSNTFDEIWTVAYDNPRPNFLSGNIHELPNGDFMLSQSVVTPIIIDPDASAIRIDSAGNMIWYETYGNESFEEAFASTLMSDGSLLVAGQKEYFDDYHTNNWLVKVASNGDSLWSMQIGDTNRHKYQHIITLSDSGYALVSTRQTYVNSIWHWDLELYRFGPENNLSGELPHPNVVQHFNLEAYPNPFNPTTTISFDLPQTGPVNMVAYDLQGRLVSTLLDNNLSTGRHQLHFDGANLPSGSYFVKLHTPQQQKIQKVVLIK